MNMLNINNVKCNNTSLLKMMELRNRERLTNLWSAWYIVVIIFIVLISCSFTSARFAGYKGNHELQKSVPEYKLPEHQCVGCGQSYYPVCATNGVTYPNPCLFYCQTQANSDHNERILHMGICSDTLLPADTCTKSCNHLSRPVCGSDNVTYLNPCVFQCAQRLNPKLVIKHMGSC